ncbi:MAG TPA: zinc ribbon domain-containing protein [Spirochaetota bacterium]|mgnify:CR=1 FL=1|nr:zinc ribbon domain-containing protein [Spirochaetota bacterium]
MPTYDYKCDSCDDTFEVFQSMNDEPLTTCEKCGGKVRRVFSAAGIIFKGSGFYVNDYKKGNSGGCSGCGSSCPSKD